MQLQEHLKGKHRRSFLALGLTGAALLTAASGQAAKKSKAEPLMIQENPGQEQWRISSGDGQEVAGCSEPPWRQRGPRAPAGYRIRGNTRFPMSDTNNLQIADQMPKFLSEKKLD